jgi:hypothetical protein
MPETQNQPAEENKSEITEYYEGVKKLEIAGYETGIRKARNTLFFTAALFLVSELLLAAIAGAEFTPLFFGIIIIQSGIFVALAFWTRSRPYAAILVGLIYFLLLWALSIGLYGFEAAYKGIIVKIIIIVFLVKAIKPARAWEEAKKNEG